MGLYSPHLEAYQPNMRRTSSFLLILFAIALAVGCAQTNFDVTGKPAAAWPTITPTRIAVIATRPSDGPRATSSPPIPSPGGHPNTLPRLVPTITLAPLVIHEAPLQFWTNPNDINGLLYDGQYLWAATRGGVVRWQTGSGESRVFTLNDGLMSLATQGLAQDGEGHIWVGYVDHPAWSEYDGEKWISYEPREKAVASKYRAMLTAMNLDPRLWSKREGGEQIWLPTFDGRVAAYDGNKWSIYGQQEGVTQNVWMVCVTVGGRVWAVGERISTAKEGDKRWKSYSLPGEAPEDSETTDLAVDGQGRAWLTFTSHHPQSVGVGCLDPETNRWTAYTHALNPAIPRQIYDVEIAQDGTIWLCGDEGVAFCRPGTSWEHLSWGISVQALARDEQEHLWVGSAHGIWFAAANGKDLRGPWLVPASIPSNEVSSLARDSQGTLWIGSPRGLSYATTSGATGIALDKHVLCLASRTGGEVWVGASDGLYKAQDHGSLQRVLAQPVTRMAFDAYGTLWICTPDGQIGPLSDSGWRPKARLAESALPVHDMLILADGSVWLGTANGLGMLSPEGSFAWADPEERFLKEDTRALALGPDGTLWIGTTNGLARRSPTGGLVRLTSTGTKGGLRSPEIRDLYMASDGTLWIATSRGISLRTPETDWFYFDLPGVKAIYPESPEVLWAGTQGGLYRLRRELFIAAS